MLIGLEDEKRERKDGEDLLTSEQRKIASQQGKAAEQEEQIRQLQSTLNHLRKGK